MSRLRVDFDEMVSFLLRTGIIMRHDGIVDFLSREWEKIMNKITTIGLDFAKNVFHVVCCDQNGKQINKKALRRIQVLAKKGVGDKAQL